MSIKYKSPLTTDYQGITSYQITEKKGRKKVSMQRKISAEQIPFLPASNDLL